MTYDATKLPATSDQFTVQSNSYITNSSEPISLDQAKQHLRVDLPDENDYISALITAARQMAEGRLNRTIMQRQRVAVFNTWADDFKLLKPPLVSVDSVGYLDYDGNSQVIDNLNYRILDTTEPARVWLKNGFNSPTLYLQGQSITITYTAGYADGEVPRPITQWMLLVIGTMYQNRETLVNGTISQKLAGDFVDWLLQPYMVYE